MEKSFPAISNEILHSPSKGIEDPFAASKVLDVGSTSALACNFAPIIEVSHPVSKSATVCQLYNWMGM